MTSREPEFPTAGEPGRVPPADVPADADPADVLDQVEEVPDPEEDDLDVDDDS
jgi:hypothetical protein